MLGSFIGFEERYRDLRVYQDCFRLFRNFQIMFGEFQGLRTFQGIDGVLHVFGGVLGSIRECSAASRVLQGIAGKFLRARGALHGI